MATDIRLRTILITRKESRSHQLFLNSSKGSFYMHHPRDRIVHTMAFGIPVGGTLAGTGNTTELWPAPLYKDKSCIQTRPIELFLVPASAPQLV